MTVMHLDFETRSASDLKQVGGHNYARHPSTDIWCAAYAFDDEPVELWFPDMQCPERLAQHIESGGTVCGHNVKFEVAICNNVAARRYGWPRLRLDQCACTMLLSLSMAHPAALEKAVLAARLNVAKDMDGHRLMMRMARPRKVENGTPVWWNQPERITRLAAYCAQDVEAERALFHYLNALSEDERELWLLDYEINQRGVYIDRPLAEAALDVAAIAQAELDQEMSRITGGWVNAATDAGALGTWLRHVGCHTDSVAKDRVIELLKTVTDPTIKRALELRQQGAKSSTAKIQKFLSHAGPDGRIRDTMQMNAAGTGRWGGRTIQPHNLPRPTIVKKDDAVSEAIVYTRTKDTRAIKRAFGPPLVVLADLLRGMIAAPPGHDLIAADWSSVEGRMLAWLAGEDWKVAAYRDFDRGIGDEIYKITAGSILGKTPAEISGDERQAFGKVPELALGYQGGVGAFNDMATTYGVHMADHYNTIAAAAPAEDLDQAQRRHMEQGHKFDMSAGAWVASEVVKVGWRRKHPAIVAYWQALEDAAMGAMREPGAVYACGPHDHRRIRFCKMGEHLYCCLPSGRKLCYAWPEIQTKPTPWGAEKKVITYEAVNPQGHWVRTHAYGGKWAENATQAACADLLRHALKLLRPTGYKIVLHVHDEIVAEVPHGWGSPDELCRIICQLPEWAEGLPLAATAWRGPRFKKD